MYVVIDEAGDLRRMIRVPSRDVVEQEVGRHGIERVNLEPWFQPRPAISGWASDCGLVMGDYQRNPVASCVVVLLGGNQQPYGGPLMFTGFDPWNEWDRVQLLTEQQAAQIVEVHSVVRTILDTHPGDPLPVLPSWVASPSRLAEGLRVFSAAARAAQVSHATVGECHRAGGYLLDAVRR